MEDSEASDAGHPRRVKFLKPISPSSAPAPITGESRDERPATSRRVTFLPRESATAAPFVAETAVRVQPGTDHLADVRYQLKDGSEVRIITPSHTAYAIRTHAAESNVHGAEVGGLLVGFCDNKLRSDGTADYFIVLTDTIPVCSGDSSQSHVAFDADCWNFVDDQMDAHHTPRGKVRLGWYHTHPTQGIFFSNHDRDAHTVFRQPYQFAVVVDPRNSDAGLFFWNDHAARELGGPIFFPLASASVSNEAQDLNEQATIRWDNVLAFGFAAVLTVASVGYRAFQNSGNVGIIGFVLLGLVVVTGLVCSATGLFRGAARSRGKSNEWLGTRLGPALALIVLTFASGLQWTRPSHMNDIPAASRASIAQSITTPSRPVEGSSAGIAKPAPGQAPTPGVSGDGAGTTIQFSVSRFVRGRNMRVGISSDEYPSVSYSLLNCRNTAKRTRLETCQIVVDQKRERQFVSALFGAPDPQPSIHQLQQAIGTPPSKVDGKWGPVTRGRFVRRIVEQPRKSFRVDLPKTGPTTLVFDAPARRGRSRSRA